MKQPIRLNEVPYYPSVVTQESEKLFKTIQNVVENQHSNMLENRSQYFPLNDMSLRADFFLRRRVQELCQGTYQVFNCSAF